MVIGSLLALSFIDKETYELLGLRPVNILRDIETKEAKKNKKITIAKPSIKHPYIKSILPKDLTAITDYDSTGIGLEKFLHAIQELRTQGKPVRIAFFGDSYIEGDMLLADFRDTMQAIFGGRGIGFCPATSEVAGFRGTITHSFSSNWKTYSMIDKPRTKEKLGISGHAYIPSLGSTVKFAPVNKRFLNSFHQVKIFYSGSEGDTLQWRLGKGEWKSEALNAGAALQMLVLNVNSKAALTLKFSQQGTLKVYGFSFESDSGIYIDNFSVRGNSGIGMASVSQKMYQQFDSLQHYDLIIMQYGLNAASSKVNTFDWYSKPMLNTLKHIQKSFKNSSLMLLSIGDKSEKDENGDMVTMKNLDVFIEMQSNLAKQTGIPFWNLFEAMGGENSMVGLVDKHMANKDYTHLTFSGGRFVANKLAAALLYEIKEHENKNKEILP
jgi:lysophospholipase L1-like esterase